MFLSNVSSTVLYSLLNKIRMFLSSMHSKSKIDECTVIKCVLCKKKILKILF